MPGSLADAARVLESPARLPKIKLRATHDISRQTRTVG
jgi:hypothetical protein